MERIVLGDAEIIRVVEWQGPFAPAGVLVPGVAAEHWKENEPWLAPDHWDPSADTCRAALQTWVVRHGGRTVVVDTGVGSGRERPNTPQFHRREGDLLALLAAAGVAPEEVDTVVNTHLHADHVGWNTVDRDGAWVPAFPNAAYLMPAADHAKLAALAGATAPTPAGDVPQTQLDEWRLMFADSVLPVQQAGQAVLWEDEYRIDDALTLEAAPGHTPGSSVLRLASHGERAVFVGDLMHSPVQLSYPTCNSCFCEDPVEAAASRLRILGRASEKHELVIPAHFGGAGAAEVHRAGAGFAITRWAG
ncbi:MBL fold metallo-hydrolase [Kitasatospora sp. NBC_01560]|uniref:MBL fold metallo-hydrolase n=1 Tax=Kitasatospora sp. NBC_01560 TaxID=2975965 RepID=UPI003862E0C1